MIYPSINLVEVPLINAIIFRELNAFSATSAAQAFHRRVRGEDFRALRADIQDKNAEQNRNDLPVPRGKNVMHFLRYDLMVFEAASQVTGFWRKNDSLAIWQAVAALLPKTASSVTGLRDLTAWKNTFKWGRISSQSCPR